VSEAQHLVLAIVGGYCVGERANTTRVAVLGFRTLPRASSRTHKAPSLLLKSTRAAAMSPQPEASTTPRFVYPALARLLGRVAAAADEAAARAEAAAAADGVGPAAALRLAAAPPAPRRRRRYWMTKAQFCRYSVGDHFSQLHVDEVGGPTLTRRPIVTSTSTSTSRAASSFLYPSTSYARPTVVTRRDEADLLRSAFRVDRDLKVTPSPSN